MESKKLLPFFAEDWDKLRYSFDESVMLHTNLKKLAQNMGTQWPIRGKDETPAKYVKHTLEELVEMPEFYGKGNRLQLLYSILQETQTFDDPFCDMVDHFDTTAKEESEALKSLEKLGVPADFPVHLGNFSQDVLTLCQSEGVFDLGQLIDFSQQTAKAIVVGGDIRDFLNSLNHLDVGKLKKILPVRQGAKGLFLAESIGLLARNLTNEQAASLLKAYNITSRKPSWSADKALPKKNTLQLIEELKTKVDDRMELMTAESQQLQQAIESSEANCIRFFAPLRNPEIEGLALAIAKAALGIKPRFSILGGSFISR